MSALSSDILNSEAKRRKRYVFPIYLFIKVCFNSWKTYMIVYAYYTNKIWYMYTSESTNLAWWLCLALCLHYSGFRDWLSLLHGYIRLLFWPELNPMSTTLTYLIPGSWMGHSYDVCQSRNISFVTCLSSWIY